MYDAIIVGAGPAGATLACQLASNGVSCLIIEKERLPRYKACAGGISVRAARLLDFDISPVVERTINNASLSYKFCQKGERRSGPPIIYMTCREKFDQFLVEKAEDAGAKLIEGQKVAGVERLNNAFQIITDGGKFISRVLIGADGANSTIARETGLTAGFFCGLGLQAEVSCAAATLKQWSNRIDLDLGTIPGGYGWCFPKKDYLSIGAAGYMPFVKRLKPYLDRLINSYCPDGYNIQRVSGAPVRIRCNRQVAITSGGALLIGEAAGLVNAFTGEGIYYAIKSSQLAAPEIMRFLKSEISNFESYEEGINRDLMPELGLSYTFARLALTGGFGASRIFFNNFISSMKLWRLASGALSGEITYNKFRNSHKRLQPLLSLMKG